MPCPVLSPSIRAPLPVCPRTPQDANDTIEDAATLFLKRGFSHAPVVDSNGTLIGILSETDILFTNGGDGLSVCPASLSFPRFGALTGHERGEQKGGGG